MKDGGSTIFRPDALRRYTESRSKGVAPEFGSSRTFRGLWVAVALLLGGCVLFCFAEVPEYASGSAVIVGPGYHENPSAVAEDHILLLVAVSKDEMSRVQPGQMIYVAAGGSSERLTGSVISVEPDSSNPADVSRRFDLSGAAAQSVTQESGLATAAVRLSGRDVQPALYYGSVYRADIRIGSRKIISLLSLRAGV